MAEYIDKEELIKTIYKNPAKGVNQRGVQLLTYILDAPVVDAAPVKYGKWIVNKEKKAATCSNCEFTSYDWFSWNFNYCPDCGAKMDNEEEKE